MSGRWPNECRANRRPGFRKSLRWLASWGILFGAAPTILLGWEGEGSGPRICRISPLAVIAGTTNTLQIRGLKLSGATAISVSAGPVQLKVELKEKKAADVPNGFEAKDVGDSLAVAEIVVPAELAGSPLTLQLTAAEGTTPPQILRVVDGRLWVLEKEPNHGFRDAHPLLPGKGVMGAIQSDKDVDVFYYTGHAQKTLVVETLAGRAGSLLDGILTLYDARGHVLATCDDCGAGRDPQLRFKLPADGTYFLVLQDAGDHGTLWHTYELNVREEP